jgi:hypothetical protein
MSACVTQPTLGPDLVSVDLTAIASIESDRCRSKKKCPDMLHPIMLVPLD